MINEAQRQIITSIVNRVTEAMNISCRVELSEESRNGKEIITVALSVPDHAHLLIGKNGQNLQALEHLVRVAALKDTPSVAVMLDVNDYKKVKASQILDVARHAVAKVRNTRRAEALAPMSSYERRVVHMELASYSDIVTESIGQEPQRRIVVKPL